MNLKPPMDINSPKASNSKTQYERALFELQDFQIDPKSFDDTDYNEDDTRNRISMQWTHEPKFLNELKAEKHSSSRIKGLTPLPNTPSASLLSKPVFKVHKGNSFEDIHITTSSVNQLGTRQDVSSKKTIDDHLDGRVSVKVSFNDDTEHKSEMVSEDPMWIRSRDSFYPSEKNRSEQEGKKKKSLFAGFKEWIPKSKTAHSLTFIREKNGPRLSIRQISLIHDKASYQKEAFNQGGILVKKKLSHKHKEPAKFKKLLEKHKIVRANVQSDFVKRIMAKLRKKKKGILLRTKGKYCD